MGRGFSDTNMTPETTQPDTLIDLGEHLERGDGPNMIFQWIDEQVPYGGWIVIGMAALGFLMFFRMRIGALLGPIFGPIVVQWVKKYGDK